MTRNEGLQGPPPDLTELFADFYDQARGDGRKRIMTTKQTELLNRSLPRFYGEPLKFFSPGSVRLNLYPNSGRRDLNDRILRYYEDLEVVLNSIGLIIDSPSQQLASNERIVKGILTGSPFRNDLDFIKGVVGKDPESLTAYYQAIGMLDQMPKITWTADELFPGYPFPPKD